jgi:hypothetical protein
MRGLAAGEAGGGRVLEKRGRVHDEHHDSNSNRISSLIAASPAWAQEYWTGSIGNQPFEGMSAEGDSVGTFHGSVGGKPMDGAIMNLGGGFHVFTGSIGGEPYDGTIIDLGGE